MVRRQEPAPAHPGPKIMGPVRTCVGCRTKAVDSELLRAVVVDDRLVPDPRRRLPGRGAWVHPDLECLRTAERRRAFPRAFKLGGPLDVTGLTAHLEQAAQQH